METKAERIRKLIKSEISENGQ